MAAYLFSALGNNQLINFDPLRDLLIFNSKAISAGSVELGLTPDLSGTTLSFGGKTITLAGTAWWETATTNVSFANGSQLLASSQFNNYSGVLTGTAGSDLLVGAAPLQPIQRASTSADGSEVNGFGAQVSGLSADGRFVVFVSSASNLVAGDTNGAWDVFLKDTLTGSISLVDRTGFGVQPDNSHSSTMSKIAASNDGRYVAFSSGAPNIENNPSASLFDIFVKDTATGSLNQVTDANTPSSWGSFAPDLSGDARLVSFHSDAPDLVAGDTNGLDDVFVKDLFTGTMSRVSQAGATEGNGASINASMSDDGRYVAFESNATNLSFSGDTNGVTDIYVKDFQNGFITRTSVSGGGAEANGASTGAAMADGGRYVAFESDASNLVAGDGNATRDIFVKDMQTGTVQRASADAAGVEGNGFSTRAAISADGRYVAFASTASNLVPSDTNSSMDIFVKDMATGAIARVSVAADGAEGGFMFSPWTVAISDDGTMVSFESNVSNLVPGDTNGASDIFTVSNPLLQATLTGGAGNDTYILQRVQSIVEDVNGGTDTVRSSVSFTLPANVENLTLTGTENLNGTGNGLNNVLTGNEGNNVLNGGGGTDAASYANAPEGVTVSLATSLTQDTVGAGLDRLILIENLTGSAFDDFLGGNANANYIVGGAGADVMAGGNGNDIYNVDHPGDAVMETPAGGVDGVQSSLSYALGANLENLTLTGNALLSGTGNGLNNTIAGNAGSNVLDGGAGVDTVSYATARAAVTVDLSITTVQFTFGAGADTILGFENLTGSTFSDTLSGDAGANTIYGGAGADTMAGGAGNDTYVVDNAGDQAIELAVGGTDTVQAGLSWTLGAEIENLTLTGVAAMNGTGNGANNLIVANAGNNILDGVAGSDTVSYAAATAGVTVNLGVSSPQLTGGSGTDTLLNIENLAGSGFNDNLTGGAVGNVLTGGAGSDVLTGGGGADVFNFNSKAGADAVTDFVSGADKLQFSQAAIRAGDGDTAVEGGVVVTGPGGFAPAAELVIVTADILGSTTTASAATAIGSASGAYTLNVSAIFAVDDGSQTGVFQFISTGADATVSAAELTLLATINSASTVLADYQFVA